MTDAQKDLIQKMCDYANDHDMDRIHDVLVRAGVYWDCPKCEVWTNTEDDENCTRCGARK